MTWRAALEHYDTRVEGGHREEVLPAELGVVHAIGQGWYPLKEPEFFSRSGQALCGKNVMVRLPVDFDLDDPDACERCVERVRTPPKREHLEFLQSRCSALLRMPAGSSPAAYGCVLPIGHRDEHMSHERVRWETGYDDMIPAPDSWK